MGLDRSVARAHEPRSFDAVASVSEVDPSVIDDGSPATEVVAAPTSYFQRLAELDDLEERSDDEGYPAPINNPKIWRSHKN